MHQQQPEQQLSEPEPEQLSEPEQQPEPEQLSADEISREIMDKLDRGVTGVHGKGMYSGQDKLLLYCVVGRKEIVALKELVDHIDPDAFVIVSDVREVHGEGFIERK